MDGFLLLYKEKNMSSFDVVKAVRRISGEKKVGHSGTLDPLASGLMILAIGRATKLLEYLIGLNKGYEVLAKFGYKSDTYDAEGCVKEVDFKALLSEGDVLKAVSEKFLGEVFQVPPKYSALKIDGRRACDIVREGGDVQMKKRKVNIEKFEIMDFDWPQVSFKVTCSKGTYIRSLIHDLGRELNCGAYVLELKRTSIYTFPLNDAVKLNELNNNFEQSLISVSSFLSAFPLYKLSEQEYKTLKNGMYSHTVKADRSKPVFAFLKGEYKGTLVYNERKGFKLKKALN
ncbi:tRNA pseudouridine(55) synthase TruB [Candidatus Peregrinibacteria bacterium]|nr:tRNA pseudouridine(55) synthase TruB [Candidatus Peregrinibacteria bacterium]